MSKTQKKIEALLKRVRKLNEKIKKLIIGWRQEKEESGFEVEGEEKEGCA